ncbi:MAG: hypothetical protein WC465_03620 [Patescibacteria group bacterium]
MKRLVVFLCLLALASGCATVRDPSGRVLTGHRSDPEPTARLILKQRASQPIEVDYRWPATDFQLVMPGTDFSIDSKTYWQSRITIRWYCSGCSTTEVGQTAEQMSFETTMLYDQKPIVIDDFFLRKMMLQHGVIMNSDILPVHIWNNRGIDYGIIEPRKSTGIKELLPGTVTFYCQYMVRRADRWLYSYDRSIRSITISIDNKDDNFVWVDERGVSHLLGWHVNAEPMAIPER